MLLRELASLIGRDQSMVFRYEAGTTPIPDEIKGIFAEFYGVSIADLMGWEREAA